jgi:hypothetical protein
MLETNRSFREAQRENQINETTPLSWDQYRELSAGGTVSRPNHLLRRLQLDTVPADIKGIIEIQKKKAERAIAP